MLSNSKTYGSIVLFVTLSLTGFSAHANKKPPEKHHDKPKTTHVQGQGQGQAQGQLQAQGQAQEANSQSEAQADSRSNADSRSTSENHSNQEVHVGANAQGGNASNSGSVENEIGGDIDNSTTYGDDYDFPVSTAAVTYAGQCTNVANIQTQNFGMGAGTQDRVCQWLNLAQARHLEAAALVCTPPQVGKGSTSSSFDVGEYKACAQQRKSLWLEGDKYLKNAASEMCSKGVLKHIWGVLWTGTSKCIDVEVGGRKPSTASVDPVTGKRNAPIEAPVLTSVE